MRTGELAVRAGVNPQTLRYYERRGLMPAPARTGSGYRAYDQGDLERLLFIRRAQGVGFTLAEVEALLHLPTGAPTGCSAARSMAERKIDDLEHHIEELQEVRRVLIRFSQRCEQAGPGEDCPILSDLTGGEPG